MRKAEGIHNFSGATAIITGGASGIGRAFAVELATRGCDVVVADLQIENAQNNKTCCRWSFDIIAWRGQDARHTRECAVSRIYSH